MPVRARSAAARRSSPARAVQHLHLVGEAREPVGDPVRQRGDAEAAVAAARAEAGRLRLEQHDLARRVVGLRVQRRPQPGEAAADDAQVRLDGAGERRRDVRGERPERARLGVRVRRAVRVVGARGQARRQTSRLARAASPVASVNARASRSSASSPRWRPTSCSPTGSPSAVKPAGTAIAGCAVTVIREQERIHSRVGPPSRRRRSPRLLDVDAERRHLGDRRRERVVALEERAHALEHRAAQRQRAARSAAASARARSACSARSSGSTSSMIDGERAGELTPRSDVERLVGAAEVRLGVLDDAAERLERRPPRLEHRGHPRLDRQPAEVAAPGDAQPARVTASRSREVLARERQWIARVGAGDRARAAAPTSSTVRRDRAEHGQRAPGVARPGVRHAAGRRAQPDEVAERGRVADARAEVRAVGERHHPGATAAAAPPLEPPGVFDRSDGLRVTPKTALNVCEPAPNSGVFVLPMISAPAARSAPPSASRPSGRGPRTVASRRSSASPRCPRGP